MTNVVSTTSTATHKHINDLSDMILKHIFDRLPLVDLLHRADRVCRFWREIQRWSCHNRLTLTLLIGYPNWTEKLIRYSTFYRYATQQNRIETLSLKAMLKLLIYYKLHIRGENACQASIKRLAEATFPSITRLQVAIYTDMDQGITVLLTLVLHYGSQLTSFKLHTLLCDSEGGMPPALEKLLPILDAIGQLPKLDHLTLDLFGRFKYYYELPLFQRPLRLPVLARLREFCFYSENSAAVLLSALLQPYALANLDNLRRFEIHNRGLEELALAAEYEDPDVSLGIERILSKLTCVHIEQEADVYYDALLSKLHNLKCLYAKFDAQANASRDRLSIGPLISALMHLPSLVHMQLLDLDSNIILEFSSIFPAFVPQLQSVRCLKLKWFHKSHTPSFLPCLMLRHIFPALRTLILRCIWLECNDCYPRPLPLDAYKHYPELCWRQLETEVKDICTLIPWLARLDFKCYGCDVAEEAEADDGEPELFLYTSIQI